jgi:hypothetical protein
VYAQPPVPGPGYVWTPGYWAWGPNGYYWVPSTWILAPFRGALWTPGYWAWVNGAYLWRAGYWGPRVGFYGGINYGFGYFGTGFVGGYWGNGAFFYNRAVNNVNVTTIQNIYNKTVVNNTNVQRISYNGGSGGTTVQPNAGQLAYASQSHTPATEQQVHREQAAGANHQMLASVNHGRPTIAATPQPGAFDHPGVVAARAPDSHPAGHAGRMSGEHASAAGVRHAGRPEGGAPRHAGGHPPNSEATHSEGGHPR